MTSYTRPGMVGGSSAGSFVSRMEELSKLVGAGKVETSVRFDQAYAGRQERNLLNNHPRGGGPKYLHNALINEHRTHMERVAMELFRGNTQVLYIRLGENISTKAAANAPIELGNLRQSGSVKVKVGGRNIYVREAARRRLTRTELNSRVRQHHIDRLQRRFG